MKRLIFSFSVSLCCLWLAVGCSIDRTPLAQEDSGYKTFPVNSLHKKVINANNAFAFSLFSQVNQVNQKDNVFISPFSVSMALGMALNGANGQTYSAMQNTLGFSEMDEQSINETYAYLYQNLQQLDPRVIFQIANSIWCKKGSDFFPEFLAVNRQYFNAEVRDLNFADPQAVVTINNWIAQATNQKIKKVLDEIPPDAVMYLINALYFNGLWTYQFPEDEVQQRVFHQIDGQSAECSMMFVTCRIPALFEERIQVAQVPFGQGNYVMTFIMPRRMDDFNEYLLDFTQNEWTRIQENLKEDSCTLGLPKLRFGFKALLNEPLKKLGMDIAFDPVHADFSRITDQHPLFINRVIHQTFIEVSEKGAEAAAVTIVEMMTTTIGPPPILSLVFDQPFVFVISERSTGAVLFMGKVMKPLWEE
ncbi:serpin family protein [Caldithrix abyssi]